ncbi:MAG: RnfABCDGE type electron transport complex subunit D [Treponema sp.]|nr:RnfABCDGE type electron transport complex subunit D [Treponema sp.]
MNTMFHAKKYESVTLKPFCYITPSVRTVSWCTLVLLVPQVVLLAVSGSTAALAVLLSSLTASVLSELAYSARTRPLRGAWLTAVIQGTMIALLLPENYAPAAVFFVVFCSLLLEKFAFGGFAGSWANPVVLAVSVAYFLNMGAFPAYGVSSNDVLSRNAALSLIQNGSVPLVGADVTVTAFLNRTVFRLFGIVVPEGYVTLFWDSGSIIPAFRFNTVTLISSIILISFDMVDALIPLCFTAVYAVLVRFAGPLLVGGHGGQGDMLLALLTSGTLFCTLYVLQWYGTTPVTRLGKVLYGVLAGMIAFLVVGCGTSPVGAVFTVLVMNVLSPMIQVFESRDVRNTVANVLVPRAVELEVEHV